MIEVNFLKGNSGMLCVCTNEVWVWINLRIILAKEKKKLCGKWWCVHWLSFRFYKEFFCKYYLNKMYVGSGGVCTDGAWLFGAEI